ncbi:MAG: tetratricopeptide repeat protein [Mucilaginibacter polytrichastri]|nr:tetratricopeptide repeat protein [Mucilaginibacter polytrichastri]
MGIYDLATRFYQADNIDFAIKIFEQGRKVLNDPNEFSLDLVNLYRYKKDKYRMADEYLHLLGNKPEFIYSAQNNLAMLFEGEKDYDMLKSALLKEVQKNPEQTVFSELLAWVFIRQKQYDQALNQAMALSRRRKDDGEKVFKLGRLMVDNDAYETATRAFDFVIKLGPDSQWYVPAKVEVLDARSNLYQKTAAKKAELLSLEQEYLELIKEFGKSPATAFALQRLATLQATRLADMKKAEATLEEMIAIKGLNPAMLATAKLDLGDYYLFDRQPWEATLVYSQVEKAFPGTNEAQEAKFRNARLAYFTGEFSYAKSQFDILKASTSQLIANDALNMSLLIGDNLNADSTGTALKVYARADLLINMKLYDKALLTLDSIGKNHPQNALADDILMARGRIFIDRKEYAKALEPLQQIVTNHAYGHWADDALFMLGDLYETKLNDPQKAMASFEKIITAHPSSLWVNEARKRFRTIRGDEPPAGT